MSDELLDAVRAGNARDIDWKELVEQLERIPALRLSLALAQAREAKLREALLYTWPGLGEDRELGGDVTKAHALAVAALATPADDGALRELLEDCTSRGYDAGMAYFYPDHQTMTVDFGKMQSEKAAIVARVIGGAA